MVKKIGVDHPYPCPICEKDGLVPCYIPVNDGKGLHRMRGMYDCIRCGAQISKYNPAKRGTFKHRI